MNQADALFS